MGEANFGRYELLEEIGQGGMGTVYRAYDKKMLREVAIKVLRPELASEHGYVERFRREAYTAAGLSEPHVIPVYEADEAEGRLYLVMPLVDGSDLVNILDRDGAMSPERAVRIVEQIGAALDAAHRAGLVHRDVKPSNILITDKDFAYLIDFGIAHADSDTKLTSTGTTIGTWGYMAPERFTSGIADRRGDIYALGCVLYQCLTGQQPYPGDSLPQQVHGHCYLEPPRPTTVNSTLPAALDQVVGRAMNKDPEQRFQTCHELVGAAIGAIDDNSGRLVRSSVKPAIAMPPTMPASLYNEDLHRAGTQLAPTQLQGPNKSRSRGKAPIAVAAVAVVLALAGGIALWVSKDRHQEPSLGAAPTGRQTSEWAGCQAVSIPLVQIPTRTYREPIASIPVPPGWERTTKMDNESIRFAIRNPSLSKDGFTPNAIVTEQKVDSDLGEPAQILEAQTEQLSKKLKATDITSKNGDVCGFAAQLSNFTAPEMKVGPGAPTVPSRHATSLGVVYPGADATYVITLTVQSVNPDDPTVANDSASILNGFRVSKP